MNGIVDRIEGEYLVVELENRDIVEIAMKKVPNAREGDVLLINGDAISIDAEQTKKRSENISKLFDGLLE